MKTRMFFDRQSDKTLHGLMAAHFTKKYRLSPQAAHTICDDAIFFREVFNSGSRREGQVIHYALKIGESPGKSIKESQLCPVKLTLIAPTDLKVRKKYGLCYLTSEVMLRIAKEAYFQGALLTLEDICTLLHISESTAKRYKKRFKEQGRFFPLRGEYADIGPATSHKKEIISLFLLGYSETEIAHRKHHSLECVEAYIRDFLRIILMVEAGYHPASIVRVTKLSQKLVTEYLKLYQDYKEDSFFEEPLKRIIDLYSLQRNFAKKGGLQE